MLSLLLLNNIVQLFLMMFGGFLLVKLRILKPEDSGIISEIILLLVNPCVNINSFQLDRTPEIIRIMLLVGSIAAMAHLVMIAMTGALKRPAKLNAVERASIVYTNCGALLLPLVMNLMGSEYVAYLNVYDMIYIIFVWSHGKMLISGEKKFSLKKILLNSNVITVLLGIVLFALEIRLPDVVCKTMTSMMNLAGPLSMIVTGMLLAGTDLKKILRLPGVWKVTFFRMVFCPLFFALLFSLLLLERLVPGCGAAVMLCFLAVSAPSASNVTHIALLYGGGTESSTYASAINVVTTICCVITMPAMVAIFQMV